MVESVVSRIVWVWTRRKIIEGEDGTLIAFLKAASGTQRRVIGCSSSGSAA
jgi:hypothetical protein